VVDDDTLEINRISATGAARGGEMGISPVDLAGLRGMRVFDKGRRACVELKLGDGLEIVRARGTIDGWISAGRGDTPDAAWYWVEVRTQTDRARYWQGA